MRSAFPLLLSAALAAFPAAAQVKITPGTQKVPVEINGKPFTDFYAAGPEVAKPYLWPLRAASGTYVTREWPMEKVAEEFDAETGSCDRERHRHGQGPRSSAPARPVVRPRQGQRPGLLEHRAHQRQPYNRPDRGKIVLNKMGAIKSGKDQGSIASAFDWNDHDGKTLLTEERLMTFYADPNLRTVDFDITLTAVQKVTFGDEKDGVFGVRLRPILQEDKGTGHITNADGKATEKEVWGKPSNWCDYSGDIKGEKVGMAILDHPGNPHHPVRWHVRAYGLFAANPFGLSTFQNEKAEKGAVTLEPGQKLRYRYRVVIHPGDAASSGIAKIWDTYSATR